MYILRHQCPLRHIDFTQVLKYVELALNKTFPARSLRIKYEPSEGSMMADLSTVRSLELVQNPRVRLLEMSTSAAEARALHIAVEHRIADVLARLDSTGVGVHVDRLSTEVGINSAKLGKQHFLLSRRY